MKTEELEKEVLSLMFEDVFENRAAFITNANRALSLIHTERDRAERLTVYKTKPAVSFYEKNIAHKSGESLRYEVKGRAFAAKLSGSGKLLFTDGDVKKLLFFGAGKDVVRNKISTGSAVIEFTGDYYYDILSFVVYEEAYGDGTAWISFPDEDIRIDMKEEDERFLAFLSEPQDKYGRRIAGASAEGKTLILPRSFYGEASICYKRRSRGIKDTDTSDAEIDISDECAHLLAPLTASYLLAEDDPELAAEYKAQYREGMASVKIYNRQRASNEYKDVLGWAK